MIRISDPNDPRISAYRDIRERDLVRRDGLFVAEGTTVLNVLLSQAHFALQSILVLENRLDGFLAMAGDRVGDTPLDPATTYRVATNDYMGRGGDGYSVFTEAPRILREEDAKLMANDVMVFLRNAGTYAPALDGRIELRR